jgi:hypothetical protein
VQRGTIRSTTSLLAACAAVLLSLVQILADSQSDPSIERVVERFNTVSPPAYRAFRRLEGGLSTASKQGWLEAWTEFVPGRGFTYEVVREGGYEYVRNKVLRGLLSSEQELIARGYPLRAQFVAKNYSFHDGGATETGLQRIILKPNRKSDGIVNGSLLLDPEAGALVRIEGRLMKSPSFWLRDVDVTWKYASVDGHDLPVEMISSGRVRIFGRSTFKMIYDYVSVDGRPVTDEMKAGFRTPHR